MELVTIQIQTIFLIKENKKNSKLYSHYNYKRSVGFDYSLKNNKKDRYTEIYVASIRCFF